MRGYLHLELESGGEIMITLRDGDIFRFTKNDRELQAKLNDVHAWWSSLQKQALDVVAGESPK